MPLQALWFRGNTRLQQCLVSDPHHVKLGDKGDHVLLIQQALFMVDGAGIDQPEVNSWYCGTSTASAVKKYKTARKIINYAYQTAPDDIVGRMTIQALDNEMLAKERQYHLLFAGAIPLASAFSHVVIAEMVEDAWLTWARQLKNADPARRPVVIVPMATGASPESAASVIKDAINKTTGFGAVILSVGHGRGAGRERSGRGQMLYDNEGYFDLAPGNTFKVGGQSQLLIGDGPPKNWKGEQLVYCHTSAYYDVRIGGVSRKEFDEENKSPAATTRLKYWAAYQDVCSSFKSGPCRAVVFLTCRVGKSVSFLQRVAEQWNVVILAYRQWVDADFMGNRRAHLFFDIDRSGGPSNNPFGEAFLPGSPGNQVFIWPAGRFVF